VVRLAPPLVVGDAQVDALLAALPAVLDRAAESADGGE
jgi:acetylornithine/N-succinyldiaminopimelate aminotransferase